MLLSYLQLDVTDVYDPKWLPPFNWNGRTQQPMEFEVPFWEVQFHKNKWYIYIYTYIYIFVQLKPFTSYKC